ncbi:dihydrofolate reductase [Undibacterium sp. TC4M20W]|uniref:dihydrofolate reductase n=1 Tax=Undibacterium sp. TC4M20W TaxID=3413052 RepID=UPI003BF36ECF
MSSLSIIVATDSRLGIGIDNKLPWHLPEDLAHFKRTTTGHAIIMGRKTFESIGRALPNRRNIVVTRNHDWQHAGVETAASLDAAHALLNDDLAYIIGGAEIYQQSLDLANELIVTEIQQEFACDAFFPAIDPLLWKKTGREKHYSEASNLHFAFVTYKKI